MDYATLIAPKGVAGSIADILNNSTIPPSVPYFIQEAESIIYRRLRHWRMLVPPVGGTMTIGSDQIAIPTDLLEPYMFYLTGSASVPGYGPTRIAMATPEQVISLYSYDGTGTRINNTPSYYYLNDGYFQLDQPPDQAYPYSLIYYGQPPALGPLNVTNWLTTWYPRLFRCAVLAQATEWTKESGSGQFDRTYWFSITEAELEKAQEESDMAMRSGSVSSRMVMI
jgi:hypothetical protein